MAHLLLLDVPGGNDFTVLEDAVAMGHDVTFFTSDLAHYYRQGIPADCALGKARRVVEIPGFDYAEFERRALAIHTDHAFEAVLCLIDIRIVEASRIARRLGLHFLAPATAQLLRDKVSVREVLSRHGIRQPAFALARDAAELRAAARSIGYPLLVKPSDGYGSQDVTLLEGPDDLERLAAVIASPVNGPTDYGFGVHASRRLAVEQFVRGRMIGCDVLVDRGERVMLGINDKRMMAPPSFAMRGSCFPSEHFDLDAIRAYAFQVLDAVGFDFGATHIEMIVAEDGPYLVEVNPRLVSAQIPFQLGYAFGASLYGALIDLHLGRGLGGWRGRKAAQYCAIRWLTADRSGTVRQIEFPAPADEAIRRVVAFRQPGDAVRPPLDNGDRIAYVMAAGASQALAEATAEAFIANTKLHLV